MVKGRLAEMEPEAGTQARVPRYRQWGFTDCTRDLAAVVWKGHLWSEQTYYKVDPDVDGLLDLLFVSIMG